MRSIVEGHRIYLIETSCAWIASHNDKTCSFAHCRSESCLSANLKLVSALRYAVYLSGVHNEFARSWVKAHSAM